MGSTSTLFTLTMGSLRAGVLQFECSDRPHGLPASVSGSSMGASGALPVTSNYLGQPAVTATGDDNFLAGELTTLSASTTMPTPPPLVPRSCTLVGQLGPSRSGLPQLVGAPLSDGDWRFASLCIADGLGAVAPAALIAQCEEFWIWYSFDTLDVDDGAGRGSRELSRRTLSSQGPVRTLFFPQKSKPRQACQQILDCDSTTSLQVLPCPGRWCAGHSLSDSLGSVSLRRRFRMRRHGQVERLCCRLRLRRRQGHRQPFAGT